MRAEKINPKNASKIVNAYQFLETKSLLLGVAMA